jgi:hypothetical protein
METELVGLKLREQVSEKEFQCQSALLRAEQTHYRDEIKRQEQHVATLAESTKAIEALETVNKRIIGKLDGATDAEKRWVLETFKLRVTVREGEYEISTGVPPYTTEIESVSGVHHGQI